MPTTQQELPQELTTKTLSKFDVLLIDHAKLDQFIDNVGSVEALPDSLDIYTEDKYTKNSVTFNAIITGSEVTDGEYGIATQLHNPTLETDRVLDLRNSATDFADYIQGL